MSEARNIPRLRFPGFNDGWGLTTLGDLGKIINGITYNPSQIQDYGVLVLRSSNIQNGRLSFEDNVYISIEKFNPIQKNDILICVRNGSQRLIGKNALINQNFDNVGFGAFMTVYRSERNPFLYHWFNTERYYKEVYKNLGATINSINGSDLKKFKVPFPSLPEQQKIADFLIAVDKRIELLEKKKIFLETYKKGVIKKIFNQEIRFKDDNGNDFPDWEEFKLNQILFEHKEKNAESKFDEVFSVSKLKGVVNQIEHLGRSYSSETIDHYKLINNWDIVYTKSPTSDFPFGIIKQNVTGRTGVLSPLYGVFKPLNKWIGKLIAGHFESSVNTYNYLNPLVQKGAKNTMNINNDTFLNGEMLSLPISEYEQEKISDFFFSIENQIEILELLIDSSKNWKKGLLQKMFV